MEKAFLSLVRLGIGTGQINLYPVNTDWNSIKLLATQQGLTAIVVDGIEKLPEPLRPPKELLLEWIGDVLHGYEYRYESCRRAIAEMAGFYNSHGYKMLVLKGYACALDWPRPEHRPCGDIDIWQFGKQKETDALLSNEKSIKIDDGHEHHTVFYWRGFMVENHYDFIDVYHRKTSPQLEAVFKELGKDDSQYIELYGEKVYLPSPNLHALFLLRHCMEHFASTDLKLRQLLDWAFFVEKHGKDVDWNWLEGILEEFGMTPAYNIFNAISIVDLGFDADLFPRIQYNPLMKERVLNDILTPEFDGKEPRALIPRIIFKYRRWKANSWKNELCFKESMWSAFWSGVWSHLLKLKSI